MLVVHEAMLDTEAGKLSREKCGCCCVRTCTTRAKYRCSSQNMAIFHGSIAASTTYRFLLTHHVLTSCWCFLLCTVIQLPVGTCIMAVRTILESNSHTVCTLLCKNQALRQRCSPCNMLGYRLCICTTLTWLVLHADWCMASLPPISYAYRAQLCSGAAR
jgi:hypothetical protein